MLVQCGGCGFLEKVLWTQRRGGIALIVRDYKRPDASSRYVVAVFVKTSVTTAVSVVKQME